MDDVFARSERRHRTFVAVVIAAVAVAIAFIAVGATLAVGALLVAVLFNPVRLRVQHVVDRRFHRARYDAEQTVAGLAGRLRDEVDIARHCHEILDVVEGSVEPTDVHLWLRHGSTR